MDADTDPNALASAIAEARRNELAESARAALARKDYLGSLDLEQLTGIPASTWRYWATNETGPPSFKLGRRRVWKKSHVLAWIAAQQAATGTGVLPDAETVISTPRPAPAGYPLSGKGSSNGIAPHEKAGSATDG